MLDPRSHDSSQRNGSDRSSDASPSNPNASGVLSDDRHSRPLERIGIHRLLRQKHSWTSCTQTLRVDWLPGGLWTRGSRAQCYCFELLFNGTILEVTQRFEIDLCMKYPILIANVMVVFSFLIQHALRKSNPGKTVKSHDFSSVDREECWLFLQMHRRDIKARWDIAFHRALWEATEKYNTDTKGQKSRSGTTYPPTFMATNNSISKTHRSYQQRDSIPTPTNNPTGTTVIMEKIARCEIGKGKANQDLYWYQRMEWPIGKLPNHEEPDSGSNPQS